MCFLLRASHLSVVCSETQMLRVAIDGQEARDPYELSVLYDTFAVQIERFRIESTRWDTDQLRASRRAYQENNIGLALSLVAGEIACVVVPHKGSGKCMSSAFQEKKLANLTDTKLRFTAAMIDFVPFIAIWNSGVSGVNKRASKLLGMEVTGPVSFILLDHDYKPTHTSIVLFKKHVMRLL